MSEEDATSRYPRSPDDYAGATSTLHYSEATTRPSYISTPGQAAQQRVAVTDISQLAAAYGLGKVVKEYRHNASAVFVRGLAAFLSALLLLTISAVLLLKGFYSRRVLWIGLAGLPLLGYGASQIGIGIYRAIAARAMNMQLYLCKRGVMRVKAGQVGAMRWDQIKAVQQIFVEGQTSHEPQQYILYPDEGEPLELDKGLFIGFASLGVRIEHEVKERLLPGAIAAFEDGQTLDFGAINVAPEGLSLPGGQKVLAWDGLGNIYTSKGFLCIMEKGTRRLWEGIEISEMINLCIFLPLINHIRISTRLAGASDGEKVTLGYQPPMNDQAQHSEWREYE